MRRRERRVKFQPQPLALLELLASRPGELVSREEIREALWAKGDHVDFDQGINHCIREIRRVLHDSPENPRFVQTVPKRGYRFVAPVESLAEGSKGDSIAPPRRPRRALYAASILLAGSLLWIGLRASSRTDHPGQLAFKVLPPENTHLSGDTHNLPQVSPDGRFLVFNVEIAGRRVLAINEIGTLTSHLLERTEHAHSPFWSTDGRFVGFVAHEALKIADRAGGTVRALYDGGVLPLGGAWNDRGIILFSTPDGIRQIAVTGGKPRSATHSDSSRDELHAWPSFLPDGIHFLYLVIGQESETNSLHVGSLDSSETRFLAPLRSSVRYSSGHLLFARDGLLFAQPFDPVQHRLSGSPRPLLDKLRTSRWIGEASFSVSSNGVLAYLEGGSGTSPKQITWFDRAGRRIEKVGPPSPYYQLALSPDGRYAAAVRWNPLDGSDDIDLIDLWNGGQARPFAHSSLIESAPVWSPDGRELAFIVIDGGRHTIVRREIEDESAKPIRSELSLWPEDWSEDGGQIVYVTPDGVYSVPSWSGEPVPLLSDGVSRFGAPELSPDRRHLAYVSHETGQNEVYVRRVGDRGPHAARVSTDGGGQPIWRADGAELFYIANDGWVMSVDVQKGKELSLSTPRRLFRPELIFNPTITQYGVSRDGERFLVLCPLPTRVGVNVILNWTAAVSN